MAECQIGHQRMTSARSHFIFDSNRLARVGKGVGHAAPDGRFLLGLLAPGCFVKPDGDRAICPFDDRALDDAGVVQHQLRGTCSIGDALLNRCIKLAPGGALAVDELFPGGLGNPGGNVALGYAGFLEVVKLVGNAVLIQPGAGLFDGAAIRNAEDGDGVVTHRRK